MRTLLTNPSQPALLKDNPSPPRVNAGDGASEEILRIQPPAMVLDSLDDLPEVGRDATAIATPSVLPAEAAVSALEPGAAVFCQKHCGRTAGDTRRVMDAARASLPPIMVGVALIPKTRFGFHNPPIGFTSARCA
ncbi:MAG: hypothetical protein H7Y43_16800 [Akkermansiaceae bacterium]|nr:hypothetical protein [Verrucomicrobiales bacterium]